MLSRFPYSHYKPAPKPKHYTPLLIVLLVLGVVMLWLALIHTFQNPNEPMLEDKPTTKTAEQLAYKCPMCGDWCNHLYVDNRGKRNPAEDVTADAAVLGPPIGCYRCLAPKVMAAGGGSLS